MNAYPYNLYNLYSTFLNQISPKSQKEVSTDAAAHVFPVSSHCFVMKLTEVSHVPETEGVASPKKSKEEEEKTVEHRQDRQADLH